MHTINLTVLLLPEPCLSTLPGVGEEEELGWDKERAEDP